MTGMKSGMRSMRHRQVERQRRQQRPSPSQGTRLSRKRRRSKGELRPQRQGADPAQQRSCRVAMGGTPKATATATAAERHNRQGTAKQPAPPGHRAFLRQRSLQTLPSFLDKQRRATSRPSRSRERGRWCTPRRRSSGCRGRAAPAGGRRPAGCPASRRRSTLSRKRVPP